MSNVNSARRVEGDWWSKPIPPNVIFGEGFYCETAQIFRFLKNKGPGAVVLGKHVSCYAGCSFAIGENGIVAERRAAIIAAGNVLRGEHRDDARKPAHRIKIERGDFPRAASLA